MEPAEPETSYVLLRTLFLQEFSVFSFIVIITDQYNKLKNKKQVDPKK